MISMAAGMALAGLRPYCYSGLIFLLMRAFEQIRVDVCYNKLPVKLIGTGASGFLGETHNLTGSENEEDLLKNLPNLKRFYPKNEQELKQALKHKGAAYIRLWHQNITKATKPGLIKIQKDIKSHGGCPHKIIWLKIKE